MDGVKSIITPVHYKINVNIISSGEGFSKNLLRHFEKINQSLMFNDASPAIKIPFY